MSTTKKNYISTHISNLILAPVRWVTQLPRHACQGLVPDLVVGCFDCVGVLSRRCSLLSRIAATCSLRRYKASGDIDGGCGQKGPDF